MAHFAEIEPFKPEEGLFIVKNVIKAEQDFIDSGVVGDPANWIQTSYNTRGGVHYTQPSREEIVNFDWSSGSPPPQKKPSGLPGLRKNYAGIGFIYDKIRDAFYTQRPHDGWILNEDTCCWEPPTPRPPADSTSHYEWDDSIKNWTKITVTESDPETGN